MDTPDTIAIHAQADVEESLITYATEQCTAERVEILWLGLATDALAAGGRAHWQGDPCRAHPQLTLLWSTETEMARYTVRPRLDVWVAALVAPGTVATGERFTPIAGLAPLQELSSGAFRGPIAVARTALSAGEALTQSNTASPPDAIAGSLVTVRVRAGDLEVRTEGRLLLDGRVGERVMVHLTETKAAKRGTLVAPDVVEL